MTTYLTDFGEQWDTEGRKGGGREGGREGWKELSLMSPSAIKVLVIKY